MAFVRTVGLSLRASPGQPVAAPAQLLPPPLVVRHDPADGLPVVTAVAAVPQVHQLVHDDVVDEAHWGLDDAPVQADGAEVVAASPALALVGDDDAGRRDAGPGPPGLDPFG